MENQAQSQKPSFKAILLSAPSKVMEKKNEGKSQYVIYNAEVTQEGPLNGKVITCAFTIKNAKGETKTAPAKGEEVLVYADIVNGKPLFEVGAPRIETADDAELVVLLQTQMAGQTV